MSNAPSQERRTERRRPNPEIVFDRAACPTARRDDSLVTQEVEDELIVYDAKNHHVHSLNHTAKLVWLACDGHTPVSGLERRLEAELQLAAGQGVELVGLALDRLQRAHLLRPDVAANWPRYDRRQALIRIGVASLLPAIFSLVAPMPVSAQSQCLPNNSSCSSDGECCSGCCRTVGGSLKCKPVGTGGCV